MKPTVLIFLVLGIFSQTNLLHAHPGSGIVVGRQGEVYFVDTGSGVWRIDTNGELTKLQGPAYHWMAIDRNSRRSNVTLPYFASGDATVTRVGTNPTILLSSDFPITVGPEGNLYYPWFRADEGLKVFRLTPSGITTTLKALPAATESGPLRWLNGMAAAYDGSVYYAEHRAIRKITPAGEIVTIIADLTLSGCEQVPGVETEVGPYLRGLDVDSQGTVYVAATGCGAVVKITSDGKVSPVFRSSSPWSPTGVAVSGEDVYVLEYLHTDSDNRREWLPRVRRVSPDGRVVTVATIHRK